MHRHHSRELRLQVCSDISTGVMSWRQTQRLYGLSPTTIRRWLARYHGKEIEMQKIEPSVLAEYEAKVAALERKVGQLTMEIELLKKTRRQRLASVSATPSIVSGPKAAPSDGGAK